MKKHKWIFPGWLGLFLLFQSAHAGVQYRGNTLLLKQADCVMKIQKYHDDILCIELTADSSAESSCTHVIPCAAVKMAMEWEENDSVLTVLGQGWQWRYHKETEQFQMVDDGGVILQSAGKVQVWGPKSIAFTQSGEDHFYGFGSKSLPFDRKGHAFRLWNQAIYGYRGVEETLNINIPFFINPRGYGLYFDNSWPSRFDLGQTDSTCFSWQVEQGPCRFYFIYGPEPEAVIKHYTHLTGRQPMPPQWALGYLQSKYGYQNQEEVLTLSQKLDEKHIPCDAIVLDLYWFGSQEKMGNLSWGSQWPDPADMIQQLKTSGKELILIEEPYITQHSHHYAEADSLGLFCVDSTGQTRVIDMWAGPAGLIDMTNTESLNYWWRKHIPLIQSGIAGFWTDLGEPETHPADIRHHQGDMKAVHNVFSLLWNRGLFQGYRREFPNQRVFQLSRAGFAGMQRWGVFPWSGDVDRSWAGLQAQLPIMLGMSLSGVGYMHSDLGGFIGEPDAELYLRWLQFGTFSPVMRPHGIKAGTHPYEFDAATEKLAIETIQFRRRLLPYLYRTAWENHRQGLPVARPMVLAYPEDSQVKTMDCQYMLGSDLLVSPVVEPGRTVQSVYLPEGQWYHLYTGQSHAGGQWIAQSLTLEHIPVFVKAGTILPLLPDGMTAQADQDTVTLQVYTGGNGRCLLYEDDGSTLAYQKGGYCEIPILLQESSGQIMLQISPAMGDASLTPAARVYQIEWAGVNWVTCKVFVNGLPYPRRPGTESLMTVAHQAHEKMIIQINQ